MADDAIATWRRQVAGGVPLDAACVDGHFPGEPVVPGAVLLGYAAGLLSEHGYDLARVRRLKFLQTLAPGCSFTVQIKTGASVTEIVWCAGETVIAQASVDLCAHDN
ncbi:MAG: hypothetical protein AAF563_03200 [Pseudomonadota bacterium]